MREVKGVFSEGSLVYCPGLGGGTTLNAAFRGMKACLCVLMEWGIDDVERVFKGTWGGNKK